jgi:pimeloyl-ACP methyl ester carboxylesterase
MKRIPLVFLPGLLCDDYLWQAQADALSDIATPHLADLSRDDSIAAMAARVLDEAPKHFALAALSMGGYVAFEIMRQAPERVTKLALFDTSAKPDSPKRAAVRKAGLASLKHGKFAGVTEKLLPQLVHEAHVKGPVAKAIMAMAARVGGDVYIRQQQAILDRADYLPGLKNIDVPTLVAVGDADVLTPVADSLHIHWSITGSKFHLFQHCGHLPALEAPDETTALLRKWLEG